MSERLAVKPRSLLLNGQVFQCRVVMHAAVMLAGDNVTGLSPKGNGLGG